MSNKKVLIVEDDANVRLGYHVLLKANHYDTFFSGDSLSAVSEARKHQPDLIILDLGLPGSGYPDGLTGHAIPIAARVTTIADVFDALTTGRVYRGALPRQEVLGIMSEEVRKGWWDGRLLDEFRGVLTTLPADDARILRLSGGPSNL